MAYIYIWEQASDRNKQLKYNSLSTSSTVQERSFRDVFVTVSSADTCFEKQRRDTIQWLRHTFFVAEHNVT